MPRRKARRSVSSKLEANLQGRKQMTRLTILLVAATAALSISAQSADVTATKPNTYAQKLVDQELAKHPEIVILVFHVINKDASDYPIIASNIGRYGKKADEDDLRTIHTGKPNLEVNATGTRFEVEMALHDGSKKTIGAIAVVYNYKNGGDKEALHQKAEQVRTEVEKQISSLDKLNGPA